MNKISDDLSDNLALPASVQQRLNQFRQTIWQQKFIEGLTAAFLGLIVSYLTLFSLDRFGETPRIIRGLLFLSGLAGFLIGVPLRWYRWVWKMRRLDQIARFLRRTFPRLGDRLLGIIELARSDFEQNRSRRLCLAAMQQVEEEIRVQDFSTAAPRQYTFFWGRWAGIVTLLAIGIASGLPVASRNALLRWIFPWSKIERFTFVRIQDLPSRLVVPASEPFSVTAKLEPTSTWFPKRGEARLRGDAEFTASRRNEQYRFELPPQREPGSLSIRLGDDRREIAILPMDRPEIRSITANIQLPAYLGYAKPKSTDARSGIVSALVGSHVHFQAELTRELKMASASAFRASVKGKEFLTDPRLLDGSEEVQFIWTDQFGMAGKAPFRVELRTCDDLAPELSARKVSSGLVLLESDVLSFDIAAKDDFGIREVGMEWVGIADELHNPRPATGEKILAAGAHEKLSLEVVGTFSAANEHVSPQSLVVRLYVTDYLPGRERIYSPDYVIHVLSAEEHAIWLTQQLKQWLRQATQVQQRETELREINRELRSLSARQLDLAENRRRVEEQAMAERANAHRLAAVVKQGDSLIQEAIRNDQFNPTTLEDWAQALKSFRAMSAHRMPSIGDLLRDAGKAKYAFSTKPKPATSAPNGGSIRSSSNHSSSAAPNNHKRSPSGNPVASPTDVESAISPAANNKSSSTAASPKLTLPQTTLLGAQPTPPNQEPLPPAESPAQGKIDEALAAQDSLLQDFTAVMDELQRIFAELEGSTFVKRLKAASRRQLDVVRNVQRELHEGFGIASEVLKPQQQVVVDAIQSREETYSRDIALIESDLSAYFGRIQDEKFKSVLDEMRDLQVVRKVRAIGVSAEENLSGKLISQAEFWADTLDRWAEELVGPACKSGEKSPGGKNAQLPPSVVLEVMRILQKEIALRDETRSAEQARSLLSAEKYRMEVGPLATTQRELAQRTAQVVKAIKEIQDGVQLFATEITLLKRVEVVMLEAGDLLAKPETGPTTIAAETEAIELLLQAKRCNPKGGGGGGSSPGGGGTGDTETPALALVGQAQDASGTPTVRDVAETAGDSGRPLPEEFRAGLDAYFHAIEEAKRGL